MSDNKSLNYYEVELEYTEEASFGGTFSICIHGTREPSIEEAAWFLREDAKNNQAKVTNVFPLTEEEARDGFNLDNEDEWPIFDPLSPVVLEAVIKYQEGYIPPRCRKMRYETKEEHVGVLLERAREKDLIPAMEILDQMEDSFYGNMLYLYKDTLYREVRSCRALDSFSEERGLTTPYETLQWNLIHCSTFYGFKENDTREKMIAKAQDHLATFLLVGDKLFSCECEPYYQVCTFGMGNNHGGTALCVSWINPNFECHDYCFNALESKAAVAKANEVAVARGDTDYVGKFKANIKVLLPEAVHYCFRRENMTKVDEVRVYPTIPGLGLKIPALNTLPAFTWDDMYALVPIANAFNDQVSYWVSRKGYTKAQYAFSISRLQDLKDQNLPMYPHESVSEKGKETLKVYEDLFNNLCTKSC